MAPRLVLGAPLKLMITLTGSMIFGALLALIMSSYSTRVLRVSEPLSHDEMSDSDVPQDPLVNHGAHEPHHRGEAEEATRLANQVKVLCWVMTRPETHEKKAVHVKATWGKRCNKLIFMSSQNAHLEQVSELYKKGAASYFVYLCRQTIDSRSLVAFQLCNGYFHLFLNTNLGAVDLGVGDGRDQLWGKTKAAFKYVYDHHINDYHWFFKADDDTFTIMENMRYMLSAYDASYPIYFGSRFKKFTKQGYMSGGGGYVLSREAVKKFVEEALTDETKCKKSPHGAEDAEMGKCLDKIGVMAGDSRDSLARGRFFPFTPATHLFGGVPKWYLDYVYYKPDTGLNCCSDTAVTFHYVDNHKMYELEYLLYHLRPYGITHQDPFPAPLPPDTNSIPQQILEPKTALSNERCIKSIAKLAVHFPHAVKNEDLDELEEQWRDLLYAQTSLKNLSSVITNTKTSPLSSVDMSEKEEVKLSPYDLIKKDYVAIALKTDKGEDAELLTYKIVDFTNKGDNYACFVTSVKAKYRQEGHDNIVTYIVKCNPCFNSDLFKHFSAFLFNKEAKFYNELLPVLNKQLLNIEQDKLRLATHLYSTLNECEEIIILKDLRPEGFKMFDRMKGMDIPHCSLVLKELGRLHAASVLLQNELSEPIDEKYEFLQKDFNNFKSGTHNSQMESMFQGYFTNGADMAEKFGGYDLVASWLRKNKPRVSELFSESLESRPPFQVVCHGDCWNNNLLFKYNDEGDPIDVRLLDLQICRFASPATDLNYLLYTSLNGNDRKQHLDSYLRSYYEAFSRVLMDGEKTVPYTQEELRKEYHRKNMFGLIMGLMVVPLVVTEAAKAMDMKEFENAEPEEAMEQLRVNILDQIDTNPILRPRLLGMFDDMIEYGVIS
ncbi:hypothetical protein Pmani_018488 [Petrolisthes manimaculis]|uniref:N-acetylgalactosaminide beta-1,3-galactosyltransferase n=1 Tax=Petrolisthes manimaculis TaxID=1843537 RepID=A0AAE1PMU7_9EUCA|nr:hypothetical protein Pmani_018488 [Petrolisthes manimaculis]